MQDHNKGICNLKVQVLLNYLFSSVYSKKFSLSSLGQENYHSSSQIVNTFENYNAYKDLPSFDQVSKYQFLIKATY